MWTGSVYMGSQNQALDVIFDNASDWLVLEGSSCTNCDGSTYAIENSTEARQVGLDYSSRSYGTTEMTGTEWVDQVCVTLQACINEFEFFLIKEQQGLQDPVDGVLGLARNQPFFLANDQGTNRGPSYMMAMENANLISENTFSFSMAPYGTDSAMDFGTPKESRMRDPEEMQWLSLNSDYFWSAHCRGFALGSPTNSWAWGSVKDEESTISNGEVYSMFDTGASAIIFPSFYFEQILTEMFSEMGGNEFEVADGYVISKCYDDFPIVYFLFGSKWLAVNPEDYVVDISES